MSPATSANSSTLTEVCIQITTEIEALVHQSMRGWCSKYHVRLSLPCQQEVQLFFCFSTDEKPESEQTHEPQCVEALEFAELQADTAQFFILKYNYNSPIYNLTSTVTLQMVSTKPCVGGDMEHEEKEYPRERKEAAYRKEDGGMVIAVILCQRGR